MNPLDKSWEFLKAPMEGGENRDRLAAQAKARREALRRKAQEELRAKNQPSLQEIIEARNNAARANLAAANASQETTYPQPPTSEPSQGPIVHDSGLTEQQKLDLKFRRGGS
jgi:hypothetical protein